MRRFCRRGFVGLSTARFSWLASLMLGACVSTSPPSDPFKGMEPSGTTERQFQGAAMPPPPAPPPSSTYQAPLKRRRDNLATGMVGVTDLTVSDIDIDSSRGEIVDNNGMTLPLLGGVFQHPVSGDRTQLGVEGGFTFGWQGDVIGVAVGGGNVVVAADNDVFLTDIFVGAYADTLLGDKTRVYVGAGPLLQWVNLNIDWEDPNSGHVHTSENGFGYGYYARTGLEVMVRPGMYVGLGVRWIDAKVDLSGIVNEFDTEGMQYFLTFTEFL